jgi:hypothetical protein
MKISEFAEKIQSTTHTKLKRYVREFLGPDDQATIRSGYARDLDLRQAFIVFLGAHLVSTQAYTVFQARQILDDLSGLLEEKGLFPDSKPDYNAQGLKEFILEIFPVKGGGFYYQAKEIIKVYQDPDDPSCINETYREFPVITKDMKIGSRIQFNQFNSKLFRVSILLQLFQLQINDIIN